MLWGREAERWGLLKGGIEQRPRGGDGVEPAEL